LEEILHYFPALSEQQREQLKQLAPLYSEWNQKINVISRKDMDAFYIHHVLHSLAIAKVIQFRKETRILDVGTGGGFPVVPLAIFFPEAQFTAVDSIGKKIKVVQAVAETLELKNLKAHHKRAEEVGQTFDFIVSRAVTRMNRFLPWVDKRLRKESFNDLSNGFLFLKGGDLEEELAEVKQTKHCFEIKDFFKDPFFETKKVIYLPA
jgi:16S rRNA (guanine527-N7)-methyltransferase